MGLIRYMDLEKARCACVDLTAALESMGYAAPEAEQRHLERAAEALTTIADALDLTRRHTQGAALVSAANVLAHHDHQALARALLNIARRIAEQGGDR